MQERPGSDDGERGGGRRLNTRSTLALAVTIAVACVVGVVVSFGQHTPAQVTNPDPSAFAQRAVTPSPVTPSPVTPSPVPGAPQSGDGSTLADDLATDEVVLFGGVGDYGNTWLWNGGAWTLAHPPVSPSGRFGSSAAYDPQTRTVLLFGGRLEPGTPVRDTWAWNGTTWAELDSGTGGPQPGEGSDMAWDPAVTQMVLLTRSGVISDPAETWVWAGTHWSRMVRGDLPAAAFYSPMGFDPVSRSLLAIGCCVGPPPGTGGSNTTWRWSGGAWTLLPAAADVAPLASDMALDPTVGRLVLCACGRPASSQPGLWMWDGSRWSSLPAAQLPVESGTVVSALDRGDLLLLGAPKSAQPGQFPVDVWSLSGSSWHQLDRAG